MNELRPAILAALLEIGRENSPSNILLAPFNTRPPVISNEERIQIHKMFKRNVLAPWCAPCVDGTPLPHSGHQISEFEPGSINLENVITTCDEPFCADNFGETPWNQKSFLQRLATLIQSWSRCHDLSILNRRIKMAADIYMYGKYTIEGDNIKTQELDFLRDPMMTIVPPATSAWSNPATPCSTMLYDAIEQWNSVGRSHIRLILFGDSAWRNYLRCDQVERHKTLVRGDASTYNLTPASYESSTARKLGTVVINADSYVVTTDYDEEEPDFQAGSSVFTRVPFLHPDCVVGIDIENFAGIEAYGAIKDLRAEGRANVRNSSISPRMRMMQRVWETQRGDATVVQTKARPLMVPGNVNACGVLWTEGVNPQP